MLKTKLKSKPLGCDESTLVWLEFSGVAEMDPKGLFGGEREGEGSPSSEKN